MGSYGNFEVDADLETKGIVRDYGQFRVTVARAGGHNKQYEKALEKKGRPYEAAAQVGAMDNDLAVRIVKEVYSETIVKNWEVLNEDGDWMQGIEDPDADGEILDFTPENVLRVLKSKKLHDLWTDIHRTANRASLFAASLEAARAGN